LRQHFFNTTGVGQLPLQYFVLYSAVDDGYEEHPYDCNQKASKKNETDHRANEIITVI
jgi:hypothetical protein